MIKINRPGEFEQMLENLCEKEPKIIEIAQEKIHLFQNNPNDTRLQNHPLKRSMEGKWAFSITDDIRIVYKWLGKTSVRFLAIGSHTKVYKS